MPSFFTRRSTNTSIVCFFVLVELGRLASSHSSPSMLARTKPSWRSLASSLRELALAVAHDRRQHAEARPLGQREDLVDHLLDRSASRSAGRSS